MIDKIKSLSLAVSFYCGLFNTPAAMAADQHQSAFAFNRALSTGINMGNALEAPREGEWGVTLEADYFKQIAEAGFTHVRLPVRWSTHTENKAPYTIEPEFLKRVDWAIEQARINKLMLIVNMHHYEELEKEPDAEHQKFLAIWKQVAEHLRNSPATVAFEIYNEPCKAIDAAKWNSFLLEALAIIRKNNPDRIVVIGPVQWNSISALNMLQLPPEDKNILATVHYYEPFHFTHQGAEWAGAESQSWLGTTWSDTAEQHKKLAADFDQVAIWAKEHQRQIYLGEFGAYNRADMQSRACWTKAVQKEALGHSFSTAYWEFCSGFGAYDAHKKEWRQPLLDALKARP